MLEPEECRQRNLTGGKSRGDLGRAVAGQGPAGSSESAAGSDRASVGPGRVEGMGSRSRHRAVTSGQTEKFPRAQKKPWKTGCLFRRRNYRFRKSLPLGRLPWTMVPCTPGRWCRRRAGPSHLAQPRPGPPAHSLQVCILERLGGCPEPAPGGCPSQQCGLARALCLRPCGRGGDLQGPSSSHQGARAPILQERPGRGLPHQRLPTPSPAAS